MSGSVTISSSSTTYYVKGFDVSVDFGINGVAIGTTLFSDHWSQSSTSTQSDTLTWWANGISATVPVCYVVYAVGGSQGTSAQTETADAIGVWGYSPTEGPSGAYGCPLPQS